MKNFPLPQKHCFAAFNPFVRMPVIDIRYINEGDIVYFTNYPHDEFKPEKRLELFIIMIDYKLYRDFFLQRRDFTLGSNLALETKLKLATQNLTQKTQELQTSQDTINYLKTQLNTLNTEINSYPIKKQSLEITNLEQDLINKKLKAQILEKELGYGYDTIQENKELKEKIKILQLASTENINQQVIGTAKSRIKNQLSYKLGQAMIENSKSLLGYIRMPYILSYIKETHQKEQKLYQEKIKANPSLKLPPLESYPDYNEAIKIKEHLSYKLGEALINADKSKLKLGYITLWFKCKNITKEHKDNHKNSPNNPNH
ncbi:hypothetical protein [Campylobacter lanienae]|uniref:hypothetical protein n=1 Tax=Campylobacter lanienae TaxID=75658 RepID=UPI000BB418DE|nr:hypothetical protein [Campylobacter lanienae]